ncbi:MAG: DEAD/DEAH box helicase family protein [Methylococcaceae bacterium]|nr:DEAD/DEAH box helicase family protein [Methylococcaceae bacterium]
MNAILNSNTAVPLQQEDQEDTDNNIIKLTDFITDFGDSLVDAVNQQNPPLFQEDNTDPYRDLAMNGMLRQPFDSQRNAVHALSSLLFDNKEKAAVLNAEMGTGKTMMAITLAAVAFQEGYQRSMVICPPHLVYKWRREILETIPDAKVWILNGPDTLVKLLKLREMIQGGQLQTEHPEFFIIGRVRMRMGYHWKPAFAVTQQHFRNRLDEVSTQHLLSCPDCGVLHEDEEGNPLPARLLNSINDKQHWCKSCNAPMWTLMRPRSAKQKSHRELVKEAVCKLPTIGPKTAEKLLTAFGEDMISNMLADNIYEFVNLMGEDGNLIFSDRQATRMERTLSRVEFGFGQGGYQPTEFIKRYLPDGFFDLLIVDEGHEYKNEGSAQGQAMGVLANKSRKVLLLTGTLMGGYASDLFYLLWRMMPARMIEDGFQYSDNGSLGSASMAFMREHGILQDVYVEKSGDNHRTAKGKRITVRTKKRPGFGPKGICRYVLPYTVFLKLKDVGDVLPPYNEHYIDIDMTTEQSDVYSHLERTLKQELNDALRKGDTSLMGVVMNALLRWPDSCFREETVRHPHTKDELANADVIFGDDVLSPKEEELIELCRKEKANNRRVLVYTTYTGKHDTTARLKRLLSAAGFKASVLRSTVATDRREEWILDQVDLGIDILICNPELVKTGLDLLEFPTLAFMQSGYNVYTIQQASRRSWRIGQKDEVDVYFFGYAKTAQITCLSLMAEKIAVSQSTSGDMPDTGLDVLNQAGDSIEVTLAKQLMAT